MNCSPVEPRALMFFASCVLFLFGVAAPMHADESLPASPDPRFRVGELLHRNDFQNAEQWVPELEKGGEMVARDGRLVINVPAGATVWFKPKLEGAVMIEYEATVIKQGGPNDRASDLNCFWMARDARSPGDIFGHKRSGAFGDYNQLFAYYVGLGGNANTTTRFRRYIGDAELRPLLPEHDLRRPEDLIVPNTPQTLRLVACGGLIQFYRDARKLFELRDAQPYTSGWFALRTVTNHMEVRRLRIYRLEPVK